jgi:hypothetical protein
MPDVLVEDFSNALRIIVKEVPGECVPKWPSATIGSISSAQAFTRPAPGVAHDRRDEPRAPLGRFSFPDYEAAVHKACSRSGPAASSHWRCVWATALARSH